MVDCILWHQLFECFHLKIGIGEGEKKEKIKNEKQKGDYGKFLTAYSSVFCSSQN